MLLGLLADDPTLEPRDVLVMCPDIEDYAPLISATFGLADDPRRRARHPGPPAPGAARRPVAAPDQPAAGHGRARCSSSPTAGSPPRQVLDLAACRRSAAGSGFDDDDLERLRGWVAASGVRWGLDAAHRAPFDLDAVRAEHLARRPRPGPAGRGDGRGRAALARPGAAARRRRQQRHRPGRPAGRAGRPAGGRARRPRRRAVRSTTGWTALGARLDSLTAVTEPTPGSSPRPGASSPRSPTPRPTARRRSCCARRRPRPARRPAARAPDPGQLPHRRPDDVLDGADALGAAPGDLPARARRRRVPARTRVSTATTCWPATRASASATRAARTASCCSTRSWPRPSTWSSSTPAPTSAPTPRAHPRCRSARSWTQLDATAAHADGRPAREHVVVRHPLQPFDGRNFVRGELGAGAVQLRPAGTGRQPSAAGQSRPAPPPFLATAGSARRA